MPQFGRPSLDTLLGSYTNQGGGVTDIYLTIDETTADDADFIRSVSAPAAAVYVTKYGTMEDPLSSTDHVFRNRYAKDTSGGSQIDAVFQLRQNYVNEGAQGLLIASRSFTSISETFTTDVYPLSATEADMISDYTALFLRAIFTQV